MTGQAEAAAQEALQALLGRRGGRIVHDRVARLLTDLVREELTALTLGRHPGSG